MGQHLALLKQLSKLYKMRDRGDSYFQNEPIAAENEPIASFADLKRAIENCYLCELSKRRSKPFLGFGDGSSGMMIALDEPSAREDESGEWFHGASGEMVKNIIERGLGIKLENIYLTAAVKCHSFGKIEAAGSACAGFLAAEIKLKKPKAIIALGRIAFETLTASREAVETARGRLWQCAFSRAPVIPTYSVGYLRSNISAKKDTFADLKLAMSAMERAK